MPDRKNRISRKSPGSRKSRKRKSDGRKATRIKRLAYIGVIARVVVLSGTAAALAAEYHSRGFNCAESVFKGLCEAYGLKAGGGGAGSAGASADSCVATAFGFGGGGSGCQCGALAGASMALSLAFGRNDAASSKEKLYGKIRALHEEFKKACKSSVVCCRVLRGKEGKKCDLYVEAAARIAGRLIEEG